MLLAPVQELRQAPYFYLSKTGIFWKICMHKGNGDFTDMCGIWVFLPRSSVQDVDAFQSCRESHGKRTTGCWLSVPPSPLGGRDLLRYQTLAAYCEFGLRPGLLKWWKWAEASRHVATDISGFYTFCCMYPWRMYEVIFNNGGLKQ